MSDFIVFFQRKNGRVESIKVSAYSAHDAKRIVRKKLSTVTFTFVRVEQVK